mmetsp:Transcript_64/g.111  ORF Transcript_64/g.111 Transcript_64/m.111 type:complete len:110 (-) Transcript_64:994-1323(-)
MHAMKEEALFGKRNAAHHEAPLALIRSLTIFRPTLDSSCWRILAEHISFIFFKFLAKRGLGLYPLPAQIKDHRVTDHTGSSRPRVHPRTHPRLPISGAALTCPPAQIRT